MSNEADEEYIGCSKFDKLRRISVIKPVSEKMGLKEGDEVSFYRVGSDYIIRKRETLDTDQDKLVIDLVNEVKYNLLFKRGLFGNLKLTDLEGKKPNLDKFKKLDAEHKDKVWSMLIDAMIENIEKDL